MFYNHSFLKEHWFSSGLSGLDSSFHFKKSQLSAKRDNMSNITKMANRLFLTSPSPHTRRATNNHSWKIYHWENSRNMEVRLKYPLAKRGNSNCCYYHTYLKVKVQWAREWKIFLEAKKLVLSLLALLPIFPLRSEFIASTSFHIFLKIND